MRDPLLQGLQVYRVGGAVRDRLLGLPVKDHDYVVVGARAEELLNRGFQPVGRDFPVFLHPVSHEEYALARTERKSGSGYTGFVVHADPAVTLEQDLARRDLTINAMAENAEGLLVDPYGGEADLRAGVLRHVSPAFVEDPVRVLRLARFAARFGFRTAPETATLLRQLVQSGELDHLVAERVWQEFAKGLMEAQPSLMIRSLRESGALAVILPELDRLFGVPQPPQHHPEVDSGEHVLLALDLAAQEGASLAVRWAVLLHDLGKGLTDPEAWPSHHGHEQAGVPLVTAVCERLKLPAALRELAELVCLLHLQVHRLSELRPSTVLKVLERADAFRRPERFAELVQACRFDAKGRTGLQQRPYPQQTQWLDLQHAARSVDAGAVAKACAKPQAIPQAVHDARLRAVSAALALQRDHATG